MFDRIFQKKDNNVYQKERTKKNKNNRIKFKKRCKIYKKYDMIEKNKNGGFYGEHKI